MDYNVKNGGNEEVHVEEVKRELSGYKENSYDGNLDDRKIRSRFQSNGRKIVTRKGYNDNYTLEYYKLRYDETMFSLNDFEVDIDSSITVSLNGIKLSAEMQKERKDWQSFLSSVLTGEVIMSEKQRISNSNSHQTANNNYQIWLEIRAATHNHQLMEEKQILNERKQHIDAILKEVISFCVRPGDVPALDQVATLLQKVDVCESLYPSRKVMMSEKPLYKSEKFQYSIDVLNSWLTITRCLQNQLKILQNWTGSENLEITKPKDSPADAENLFFLERILKENSLKQTFEKKILSTLDSLLLKAKCIMIENADAFARMRLPSYINKLQQLLNFPTKFMEECMKLLLEISSHLTDPTMHMIQDRMDDFRISLILACQIKHKYLELIKPATGWEIPPCIDENYNAVLLESLKFYLRLLQWKFKGGYKTVFFKEVETLENEWSFLSGICHDIAGGDIVVAEQFCILTNKLHQNVITYYETNLELPKDIDKANLTRCYNKILDSIRLRCRKIIRFAKLLFGELENAAEYFIDDDDFPNFIKSLENTNHVLIYPDTFKEDNICFIIEQSLNNRSEQIKKLLKTIFTPYDRSNNHEEDSKDAEYILVLSPRVPFEWNGPIMLASFGRLNIELKNRRTRLIANGSYIRLQTCKQRFHNAVENCGIKVILETCVNVPSVNHEIIKAKKTIIKLVKMIIDSVKRIREVTKNLQSQDLIENFFSFATEIGQRCMRYMHRDATLNQLNIKLTHMAIDWVSFICDDCIPNDRKTFRWAVIALEFAMIANHGSNIFGLSEEAFSLLHNKVARCMVLLISHVDILGARSSSEAKEQQEEKYEEHSKPSSLIKNKRLNNMISNSVEDSLMIREEWVASLNELESRRSQKLQDQRLIGKVLEDQPENRPLVFLASSSSSISLRWQQGKFIGGGTFGSVYLAINLDTSDLMAVKEIRFQDLSSFSSLYKSVKEEMSVLEMLDHPNVVSYYGVEVHRDKVYIFMEYCQGGSLASQLEHGRIENEKVIKFYVMQMLQGLIYLHENNIIHRDIKPDNILLDHMECIKLVDFGAAKILAKNQKTIGQKTAASKTNINSLTGTPMYMAPEIITGGEKGRKGSMDIWSLGCCILEMVTGKRPWSNLDNEWAIMYHVVTGNPPLPDPSQLSESGMDFLAQCFVRSAQQRPTAKELIKHPWIADMFKTDDANTPTPTSPITSDLTALKRRHVF